VLVAGVSRFATVLALAFVVFATSTAGAVADPPRPGAAIAPDPAARTPLARAGPARATATISRAAMCGRLATRLRRGGRAGGTYVIDAETGRRVCGSHGRVRRIPASNMKLFTTATALARFGSEQRLQTSIESSGEIDDQGVLHGSLYLVGGGDPALAAPAFSNRFLGGLGTDIFDLTQAIGDAGIQRVTGRLYADDTIFDRVRGVADSGFSTSPYIGPLSGLDFDSGYASDGGAHFATDPAIIAASRLADDLRQNGVQVPADVALRAAPADAHEVGAVNSPPMNALTNETDVDSNNFFAEMLLKDLGARFGSAGSTAAGAAVVRSYVRGLGTGVHQVDGSGLTRSNRVTPAQVARLLVAMRKTPAGDDFVASLPVAGREGTVAHRMRGTAAAGRCRTKTGTLTGVSALSGYCFNRDGHVMAFSILMNGVGSLTAAHVQQDRMAALIARY
jgi:serine-type D-Ala-D-Ala carboxypeptidase/endopeptidase (penicillin-binding protein 4)